MVLSTSQEELLRRPHQVDRPYSQPCTSPSSDFKWFPVLRWIYVRSRPNPVLRKHLRRIQEAKTKRRSSKKRRRYYTSQHYYEVTRAQFDLELKLNKCSAATDVVRFPTEGLPRYKYCVLPSEGVFRCFDLAPGDGDEPLCGSLVRLPISSQIQYEAISYRWDAPPFKPTIKCDGGYLEATTGVVTMLRQLRLPSETRRLWIDSLCIDQESGLEKGAQIKQMASIYRNASRTTIWLGEEDHTTRSAFNMLGTLIDVINKFRPADNTTDHPSFDDLQRFGLPPIGDERWKPLSGFFNKSWFTRRWILQEVTLSKNSWIQCGDYSISWHNIAHVVFNLRACAIDTRFDVSFPWAWQVAYFHATYLRHTGASLLQLLFLARFAAAKEAEDSVLAILGLAKDKDAIWVQVAQENSAEEIFTIAAIHYLLQGRLEILNFASDPSLRELQNLPSWIPDWSSDAPSIELVALLFRFEALVPTVNRRTPTILPRIIQDSKTLIVKGCINDRIQAVGVSISPLNAKLGDEVYSHTTLLKFEHWRFLASKLRSYPTGQNLSEAFARTLSLGWDITKRETSYAALYAEYGKQLGVRIDIDHQLESYTLAEIDEYVRWIFDASRKRTFFITKMGYIGLGPYFLRPRDLVVHFDGGATPFTIRETKSATYRLVGDVYIHGMMDPVITAEEYNDIHLV